MRFDRVSIRYAGKAQTAASRTVMVDATGMDVVSVTVEQNQGTWSTAVLNVRDSNSPTGTFSDYDTPVTLTSSAKTSGILAVRARYILIDVTTGEGADAWVDISIEMRRAGIGLAVGI